MKRLVVVRHSKSSWKNPDLSDFDRPLNKRGNYDLPLMAKLLAKNYPKPDLIISSAALRAQVTSSQLCSAFQLQTTQLVCDKSLYHAGVSEMMTLIRKQDQKTSLLYIVGHNPGLSELINTLGEDYLENLPTTGAYGLNLNIQHWKELSESCATKWFYEYPKKHFYPNRL